MAEKSALGTIGPWVTNVLVAGITALSVGYASQQDRGAEREKSVNSVVIAQVNAQGKEIAELRLENKAIRDALKERDLEVIALKSQLAFYQLQGKDVFSRIDSIQRFVDGLPWVVWVKGVQVNSVTGEYEFPAVIINRAYEDRYKISRHLYIGRTVFDVPNWSDDAASKFHDADRRLYETKISQFNRTCFPDAADPKFTVCTEAARFYVLLDDGTELLGGVAREVDRYLAGSKP